MMNDSVQTSDREQIRVKFSNVNGCESQQERGFQRQSFLRRNLDDSIQLTTARRQRAGLSAYTLPRWMDGGEDWGGFVTALCMCAEPRLCCSHPSGNLRQPALRQHVTQKVKCCGRIVTDLRGGGFGIAFRLRA